MQEKVRGKTVADWQPIPGVKTIHQLSNSQLEYIESDYPASFITTTGRAGSLTLSVLAKRVTMAESFHEPFPSLMAMPRTFHARIENNDELEIAFRSARYERVCTSAIKGRIYCEVNQALTYLFPVIRNVFRSARLFLLVRHPGRFIVSGIRLGWYKNDTIWEHGRPCFVDNTDWGNLTQVEKLALYWKEINDFSLRYIDDESFIFRLESAMTYPDIAKEMLSKISEIRVSDEYLTGLLKRKFNTRYEKRLSGSNMHRNYDYPDWDEWTDSDKEKVWCIVGSTAAHLGYDIER